MIKYILIFTTLIFSFNVAFSHGTGQTIEKESNGYFIDIDYDSKELRSGESVRFNFNLWSNKERTNVPDFTDVWVRIAPSKSPGIVYAGDMHKPSFGSAGFTYIFPWSDDYELTVRFQNMDEKVTEDVTFPISVGTGNSSVGKDGYFNSLMMAGIGFILGLILMATIRKIIKT